MRLRLALTATVILPAALAHAAPQPDGPAPPGMVWVPGGDFMMGSDDDRARNDEKPAHRVRVDGFWMDATEVTNAQFREFVEATGYVTTAEKPIDWDELSKQLPEGTPRPPDDVLAPGSLVFNMPDRPVPLNNIAQWWSWTHDADWRRPQGPGSTIEGKDDHPAVHISWDDAVAYCAWAGKRLPTEAEWEFASRGGLDGAYFVWGDDDVTPARANTWQGEFPHENTKADGYFATAPVKTFPPNDYGLYDMAGNVWEWCADWYRHDTYESRAQIGLIVDNPIGPNDSYDPAEPLVPKRVQRGGSFLCHVSYCESYRPAARMKSSADTGMMHAGFRAVMTQGMWEAKQRDGE